VFLVHALLRFDPNFRFAGAITHEESQALVVERALLKSSRFRKLRRDCGKGRKYFFAKWL
jgi:hypothetical protein